VPILLPLAAARDGLGHVGLVMGAFYLGAFAAPLIGSLADRYRAYRSLAAGCAAACAVSLWLFALSGPALQLVLALANGAGFAGALTIASLLIVERHPESQWNQRLGWLETALSVGQGAGLVLAAWLTGFSVRNGLLAAALVPAAAVPLALVLIPVMRAPADRSGVQPSAATDRATAVRITRISHRLPSAGQVGEWGPASPSRAHYLHQLRRRLPEPRRLLAGGLGWLLAAWIPAYAGSAVIFALYPVLFRNAFGVAPHTSSLAFAGIVFLSLPLFPLAGRASKRIGSATVLACALAARVLLLGSLAALAAIGHVGPVLPLVAFAGIMFAWSFLSVASPALTGELAPGSEGDAQGLLNASSGLAGLAGSVAGGLAAEHLGYPAALAIGAAAVAIGLAIVATKLLHRGQGDTGRQQASAAD
jgi:MFS family permease